MRSRFLLSSVWLLGVALFSGCASSRTSQQTCAVMFSQSDLNRLVLSDGYAAARQEAATLLAKRGLVLTDSSGADLFAYVALRPSRDDAFRETVVIRSISRNALNHPGSQKSDADRAMQKLQDEVYRIATTPSS